MSIWRFVIESLRHHRRGNIVLSLGVAAATAVLTGALLVGDSVRGSLRGLTLERLGEIDSLLFADRFFRQEMVTELNESLASDDRGDKAIPAIMFPRATVENARDQRTYRASRVLVLAAGKEFWSLDPRGIQPARHPGPDEIVLNRALAEELRAEVGDDVVLRLPQVQAIPAESPLGAKEGRVRGIPRLTVIGIIEDKGLGRFSLTANQSRPRNAFVAPMTLQRPLDQRDQVNAILLASGDPDDALSPETTNALSERLSPSLADYGLTLQLVRLEYEKNDQGQRATVLEYLTLISDRMIFDDATAAVSKRALADHAAQPVLTYLANALAKIDPDADAQRVISEDEGIPYSTVTAVDSTRQLGPLVDQSTDSIMEMADDEIVLNSWAAADLEARPGDTIRLVYFLPETTHGQTVEAHADFRLKAIVPLTKPESVFRRNRPAVFREPPSLANDPNLTPEVQGVTDQQSISNWDVPFELTRRVRSADEDYYDNYRLTPKAFISLDAGQGLWKSRFGQITSFRIPLPAELDTSGMDLLRRRIEERLLNEIRKDESVRFSFSPIKHDDLEASSGTTPFDGLFLALSFFIIVAALMLVSLLFRLGIEQRASEVGLLLAVGLPRKLASRAFVIEASLVACLGAFLGVGIGIGYAQLMIYGLKTIWVGAITTPFLEFHWTARTLLLGYIIGVVVCIATIVWSIRGMRRTPARRLLLGQTQSAYPTGGIHPVVRFSPLVLSVLAGALSVAASTLGGQAQAQASAFVGAGVCVLMAFLLWIRNRLRRPNASPLLAISVPRIASNSAKRNPGRSTLTIGLIASAGFLIVAMSSFHMAPTVHGTGGFHYIATSSEPIFKNLNDPDDRRLLLAERADALRGSVILPLRMKSGDDASCNNLYRANQPRVLGVTPAMVEYFNDGAIASFKWASSAAENDAQEKNPWLLLNQPVKEGEAIPVVIDKNTAMYSLDLYGGIGEVTTFEYDGRELTFQVVGLLSNTVLQGSLLISDANFREAFPEVSGHRYFLVRGAHEPTAPLVALLEEALGDQGFEMRDTEEVLSNLLTVQNTYLGTFQSLGALGLLLGTFGVATVQLRNVLERRSELALMRAAGFRRRRLAEMVMLENMVLLFGGLGVGVVSALIAVLPHMYFGDAHVPLRGLLIMLGAIIVVGGLSGLFAVRAVLKAPVIAALRGH